MFIIFIINIVVNLVLCTYRFSFLHLQFRTLRIVHFLPIVDVVKQYEGHSIKFAVYFTSSLPSTD